MTNQNFILHVGISVLIVNGKLQRWRGSISDFLYMETHKLGHLKIGAYLQSEITGLYLMLYEVLEQLKNLKISVHPFVKEIFQCQYVNNQYTGKDRDFFQEH